MTMGTLTIGDDASPWMCASRLLWVYRIMVVRMSPKHHISVRFGVDLPLSYARVEETKGSCGHSRLRHTRYQSRLANHRGIGLAVQAQYLWYLQTMKSRCLPGMNAKCCGGALAVASLVG